MGNSTSFLGFAGTTPSALLPGTFPDDNQHPDVPLLPCRQKRRREDSDPLHSIPPPHKRPRVKEDPPEHVELPHSLLRNDSSQLRAPDAPSDSLPEFEILRSLGQSSEGKVYLVKSIKKSGSELVAVKKLRRKAFSNDVADLECLGDLLHLKDVRMHPFIIFMSQIDIKKDLEIWLTMEYANGGDLLDYCERANLSSLSVRTRVIFALHVFIQLAQSFAFLHNNLRRSICGQWSVDEQQLGSSIIHGDCKPENVLLVFCPAGNDLGMPDVRLGDFGHATPASKPLQIAGSPLYFCPEVKLAADKVKWPPMSVASDVYTFGLTMFSLITGGRIWRTGRNPQFMSLPKEYESVGFYHVLEQCLAINPRARPTMDGHGGHGITSTIDHAYKLRADLFARHGHIDSDFWLKWRREALKKP